MGIREELQKRVDKKEEEVRSLEVAIREGRVYIQALQETMKLLPREGPTEITLRPGSNIARARDAIKAAGKPLHIRDILKAVDPSGGKDKRLALSGSLGAYVRKGEIFTRPAPNTFGLIDFARNNGKTQDELPINFGLLDDQEVTP